MNRTSLILILLVFVPLQIISFLFYLAGENIGFYIASLSIMSPIIIMVGLVVEKETDLFSPLYMVLYLLVIGVVLKTIYLIIFDDGFSQTISLDARPYEILIQGNYATILGCLSLLAGYLIPLRKSRIPLRGGHPSLARRTPFGIEPVGSFLNVNNKNVTFVLLFVAFFSVALFSVFFYEMDLGREIMRGKILVKRTHEASVGVSARGSSLGYLRWGAQTIPQVAVLVILAFSYATRKPLNSLHKILVVFLAALSFAIPLLTSARLEMVYFVLMLLMVRHYYKQKISVSRLILLGVAIMTVVAVLGQLRHLQTARQTDATLVDASSFFKKTLGGNYFMDIGKTSVIVDSVPREVDYLSGKSLTYVFVAPIPRTLWPEKPAVRVSKFVGSTVYHRGDESGIPPGFIGEMYLNFGYTGIIAGMFVLGIILKLIYQRMNLNPSSHFSLLWYVILSVILTLTLLSGDLTVAVSQALRYGLPLFLFSYYMSRTKKQSMLATA